MPERRPRSFHDLAELLGEDTAWELVDLWGGTRRYIPIAPDQGHPLVERFGMERARWICQALGRGHIEIPAMRKERVLRLSGQGYSAPAIADKVGVTDVRVRQILKEDRDDRQVDLFRRTG